MSSTIDTPELEKQISAPVSKTQELLAVAAAIQVSGDAEAPAAETEAAAVDDETTKEEETPWPPADWKDTFKIPENCALRIGNKLAATFTTLGQPPPEGTAESEEERAARETPVLLLCANLKKLRKDNEFVEGDWKLHDLSNLPGIAKAIYFHKSVSELVELVGAEFGDVGIIWHPVPVKDIRNLWTIAEIFVMPGSTIMANLVERKTPCVNHGCKRMSSRMCKICQAAPFCSADCEQTSRQNGAHGEEQCFQKIRQAAYEDVEKARKHISSEFEKAMAELEADKKAKEAKKAAALANKEAFDKEAKETREKLQLSSAVQRAELGLAPSETIDAAISEKAAELLPAKSAAAAAVAKKFNAELSALALAERVSVTDLEVGQANEGEK